jgi:hypothetical protein
MTKTFFTYNPALMTPRTAKYVETMIREGDGFDYDEWLKRVRQEESEAQQTEAKWTPGELGRAAISKPMRTLDKLHGRPNPLFLTAKTIRLPRARATSGNLLQNSKGSSEAMARESPSRLRTLSIKSQTRQRV